MITLKDSLRKGKLFIGGVFTQGWRRNATFRVFNPATEEEIADVIQACEVDVNNAVISARDAFRGEWGKLTGKERGAFLYKIAELLKRDLVEFAKLETIDNGKPISETTNADLPLAIQCFEYFAEQADNIKGETIPVAGDFTNFTMREPIGVVAQIIPWNFPLLMLAWKIAPALACGNTIVLKPAEQTPLSALRFAELLVEAKLPAGVVNIITGDGETGKFLVEHNGIDKIAFTGSTEVGRLIGAIAGKNLKRCSLELGGKSPNIVFADADIDKAVDGIVTSIFFNQGEVCCAGSRLFLHEDIKEEVLAKLKIKAKSLIQGDPLDPKTQIGTLVSKEQYTKVCKYIGDGIREGAKVIVGGYSPRDLGGYAGGGGKTGFFIPPTILEATDDNICAREEIFGPVVTVLTFKDEDDVIRRANDTNYGLAAGVWTKDLEKAERVGSQIKAGTIWINCYNQFDAAAPFGGYKDSGIGREMGTYALDLYTEIKDYWIPKG